VESDKGHDAFLLDEPVMDAGLQGFLASAAEGAGL
jgi:homoserine O-acetyltransferase